MEYEGARIQLLDIPGIIRGASEGKGRGREVISMARAADLILILLDTTGLKHLKTINNEMYMAGFRFNKEKPDVKITKDSKGGLIIDLPKKSKLTKETAANILKEFGILNATAVVRENIDEDQLIDVILDNRIYIPSLVVLNKIDLIDKHKPVRIKYDIGISAEKDVDLDKLKKLMFKKLNLIRIYCKQIGKKPDLTEPVVMKKHSTVEQVCTKLHREFVNKFRFVRIWGSSKFPGQKFGLTYKLKDKDIIEIHLR